MGALNLPSYSETDGDTPNLALLQDLKSDKTPLEVTVDVIEEESGVSSTEIRNGNGLVRVILGYVVGSQYEKANRSLEDYILAHNEYPNYEDRVARYKQHCSELIAAIKVKRSMSVVAGLSNAKQHELREKVYQHFRELKSYLDKIERILQELRLEDVRATVWFVKALCVGGATIFSVLLVREVLDGGLMSLLYVTQDVLDKSVSFLFALF